MLYIRQILILFVGLYTVRVVLDTLGVEDYGVYNVVGGIVSLLSFFSSTMASASQRFFSFALGQGNLDKLKKTFSVNWIIYLSIALLALLLLETIGLWFVNEKLQVPTGRLDSAILLYHFSVFTFIASIFTTPFMAMIIAHEDMKIYAYISVIETLMKLTVVILLQYLSGDKLEIYGLLIFAVTAFNLITYLIICSRRYVECQFKEFYWDRQLIHELLGFTGWTLFGQLSNVARIQAVTILLNQMFNPSVVAARAIAINITSKVKMFSNNFNVGLYPPIIKSYAAEDTEEFLSLIFGGSKITFFLMWVFALPMFLEMETLLQFWLKEFPPMAILFVQLSLVEVLINTLSSPLVTAARAPGRMRNYELTLGSIQIAIFIVSWIILKMGFEAYSVFVIAIVANSLMLVIRLFIVKSLLGFPILDFFHQVLLPISIVIILSAGPSYFLHQFLPKEPLYSIIVALSSIIFACISMFYVGLDKKWRRYVISNLMQRINNVF